jgi:single-strand DNA-binding protein
VSDGLNRATLLGNVGRDPELRVTGGGTAVLELSLATNESYLDRNNVRQERTEWHRITIWGKRGEALAKFLKKGMQLYVEGRLETSSYDKDGQKHYSTKIVATNVVVLGTRGGGQSDDRSPSGGGGGQQRRSSPRSNPAPQEPEHDPEGAGTGDDDIPF